MIRQIRFTDLDEIQKVHERHFEKELVLPDFLSDYLAAYLVEDSEGIIAVGGVRSIAEAVTVSNKDRDPRARIHALYQLLDALSNVSRGVGFDQLHAFVQDPKWIKR